MKRVKMRLNFQPLATRMRPRTMAEFVAAGLLGEGKPCAVL